MTDEDASQAQLEEQNYVYEGFVRPRLEEAKRVYDQGLTSLWIGNGAAALAVLSFIGAAWHDGQFPSKLLWPLWCFVIGLVLMGIGTGTALVVEARAIRSMEQANSVLDFQLGHIRSPTEQAGLSAKDWRTRMAVASAVCFVLGCLVGLIELTVSN